MNPSNVLKIKVALEDLSKADFDLIAKSLGIEGQDRVWRTAIKILDSRQTGTMPSFTRLTLVDVFMAKFSWEMYRIRDTLKPLEVKKVEQLLDSYRIYLQANERNPKQMEMKIASFLTREKRVRKPVKTKAGGIKVEMPPLRHTLSEKDKSLISKKPYEEKEELLTTGKSLSCQTRFVATPPADLDVSAENLKEIKTQLAQLTSMLTSVCQKLEKSETEGGPSVTIEDIKDNPAIRAMTANIIQIRDMQISTTPVTDLPWSQTPLKIRLWFAREFKRVVFSMVTAPITVPTFIVKKVIFQPMVQAADYWTTGGHIAWGTLLWIIVIGYSVHVFYNTDPILITNMLNTYSGVNLTTTEKVVGGVVNKLAKPAWMAVNGVYSITYKHMPTTKIVVDGWATLLAEVSKQTGGYFLEIKNVLWPYLTAFAREYVPGISSLATVSSALSGISASISGAVGTATSWFGFF